MGGVRKRVVTAVTAATVTAVVSHEKLYAELVTQNKRLTAMKKQQRVNFARCDQLQAAILNYTMIEHEKKMDAAVIAGTCMYVTLTSPTINPS